MFWKQRVPISEHLFQIGNPGMSICRLLGLYPFDVYENQKQLYVKWSPVHALYSFILGSLLVIWSYQGLLEDMWDDKTSIRINTETEVYVMFCDISVVQLVVVCAIFVYSFEVTSFFEYVTHLTEVDLIIPPSNTTSGKNKSLYMVITGIISTVVILVADVLVYIRATSDTSIKMNIVKRYLPFYITYLIMMLYQYQFWHWGHCVVIRLKDLSKRLESYAENNKNHKKSVEKTEESTLETISKIKWDHRNISFVTDKLNKIHGDVLKVTTLHNGKLNIVDKVPSQATMVSSNTNIIKLASAYLHLSDSVGCLNQLLGITHAITILGILWHLIESPFHLLTELAGSRRDLGYAIINAMWCLYHFARLLIFVEPCNSCVLELETFSLVLIQGKFEFSAAGLTTIDRALVTAILGTITTYLVILLQFQNA